MAFTSETSNSGYKAPSALLREQFKMEAGKDYTPVFSGKHDNSILGVANKDYPAAAIANSVKVRMEGARVVKPEQTQVIYKSQTFPTTGYGHVYNLKPELAAKVREAFFSFNWEGTALAREFNKAEPPQEKFMPITYKQHWQVVRDIDRPWASATPASEHAPMLMLRAAGLDKRYPTGDLALKGVSARGRVR
jgi:phosphonate transport system substrate-binding protein